MESDADLRAELQAAIAKVTRQIEVQSTSRPLRGVGTAEQNAELVAELQAELTQLEDALAGLGGAAPAGQPSQPAAEEDVSGGGVLMWMRTSRRPPFNPTIVGVFLTIFGGIWVAAAVLVAVTIVITAQTPRDRTGRVMPWTESALVLALVTTVGGAALAAGIVTLRRPRAAAQADLLVR